MITLGRHSWPIHLTIYPLKSAMHGACDLRLGRLGWLCFKVPTKAFGRWWPAYVYLSPDATPSRARWFLGKRRRYADD